MIGNIGGAPNRIQRGCLSVMGRVVGGGRAAPRFRAKSGHPGKPVRRGLRAELDLSRYRACVCGSRPGTARLILKTLPRECFQVKTLPPERFRARDAQNGGAPSFSSQRDSQNTRARVFSSQRDTQLKPASKFRGRATVPHTGAWPRGCEGGRPKNLCAIRSENWSHCARIPKAAARPTTEEKIASVDRAIPEESIA